MGTTIGNALLSYDVSSNNQEVKQGLIDLGYFDYWKKDGVRHELPETTLWKKGISSDQAMFDLKSICKDLEVTIDKAISVRATEFVAP